MAQTPKKDNYMKQKNIDKLINDALAIEFEDAKDAGALGFMARAMTQATMPHSKTEETSFERTNGLFSLTMLAPPSIGLPYGTVPRLLMAWVTTEAVQSKDPVLYLGPSLTSFMRELGLVPTGGRWGSISRVKEQTKKLFSCAVSCNYSEDNFDAGAWFIIAKNYQLWWEPKNPEQSSLWRSTVTLSTDFFEEINDRPVPLDMRALRALKQSPLALDIYCWLTYRMSYLKRSTTVPWQALQMQFGSSYPITPQGTRDFKKKFIHHLKKIYTVYPEAKITPTDSGLVLAQSKPHIKVISS